jgi:hypothetical protein
VLDFHYDSGKIKKRGKEGRRRLRKEKEWEKRGNKKLEIENKKRGKKHFLWK